jgi:hypothetical protein
MELPAYISSVDCLYKEYNCNKVSLSGFSLSDLLSVIAFSNCALISIYFLFTRFNKRYLHPPVSPLLFIIKRTAGSIIGRAYPVRCNIITQKIISCNFCPVGLKTRMFPASVPKLSAWPVIFDGAAVVGF